ncbi:carbohydrate kinase [Solemya pervernicosa gill symbiont]|uniref:Carbohydrate kinase n=2 Tax=Gammaproteobacteria incertae sedis TaxID=118884 RepID=A0A1T2L1J5_9GAMM|nr:carbohydrate kinase [Solemya pervernicosa gill symbiont]QKQ28230.1 FGGY-family carbohydrate kinase [Candidatus Reidiella endopervernicosa]
MSDPLYIGIDVGTSGCRAIAIDTSRQIVAESAVCMPAPEGNGVEQQQNPEIWWQALSAALKQLGESTDLRNSQAIAVDATSGTLLLCDEIGQPLTLALIYNDSRSRTEAEQIAAIAPPFSGAHGASSSLAKLLHLLPQAEESRYALHQADWLAGRLSGRFGISDENNALKLGYDPMGRCWPEWMAQLGIDKSLLPEVKRPGEPIDKINKFLADQFGLHPDTLIKAGTTDSIAAFIASGAKEVGEAVTSLGSTLVLKVISDYPIYDPLYGIYSHRLGDLWLTGGASNSGGTVLRQFFSNEQMEKLTPQLKPDEHTGLNYYPLPRPGERFPHNDPTLEPRLTPHPEDETRFFQGVLEGIARIECDGYTLLAQSGAPYPSSVRSCGGGARNLVWRDIRQRQLGVPMLEADHLEAAYGAALLALDGLPAS